MTAANANWRPHIDGLRAVAVLSVLFYHSGMFDISGGYVGVDVFFVISGFLISRVIYEEIKSQGRFRVANFYERRLRRILPVFVAVTAAVVVAGYFVFLPDEFAELGRSAIYASAFAANIYFYHVTGYFGGLAITLPLLHCWSLGVEEQFYIIFPIAVLIVVKSKQKMLPRFLLLILGASLALAEFYMDTDPKAAFYLAPPRAWELIIGGILAIQNLPVASSRMLRELAGAAGLSLIVFAALKYDDKTAFPGLAAAVPVSGALLILWSCEEKFTYVGALLSIRPLRWVGLWSYSIYMFHWPIIVLARVLWPHGFAGLNSIIVISSIILGCVSYTYIEMPFRGPRQVLSRPIVFAISLASLFSLSVSGALILWLQGFPGRLPESVQRILAYDKYDSVELYRRDKCFIGTNASWHDLRPYCLSGDRPSALLWGDSHAADIYEALRGKFPGVAILQANMAACVPIVGLRRFDIPNCKEFNDEVLRWAMSNRPDAIILSADWPREVDAYSTLDDMLDLLRPLDIPVTLVGATPFYLEPVPKILARRMLKGSDDVRAEDEGIGAPFWSDYYMKSRYSGRAGVRYISSRDTFCVDRECPLLTQAGVPINWDRDHFTREGAVLVVNRMFQDGLYMKTAR